MMTPPSQLPSDGTLSSVNPPMETIVVPSQPLPQGTQKPATNPLFPQGIGSVPPPTPSPVPPSTPPPSSVPPPPVVAQNPWPKRLLLISIFLCLAALIVFGVRYGLSYINANKEVTISYWGLWENDAIIRPIINEFEAKYPNIKVQYQKQSHKQYRQRLQSAIERDEGPDVFRFHSTWVPMLQKELSAVPTTVMTPTEFASVFYPVAKNDLVAGQTIYGIPLMIDGLGLYYNEDLFAAAGITVPPSTWAELLSMIPKIAKPEGSTFAVSAIALGTTGNIENFSDILANMFMQNGASLVTPTGKEAEETLSFYRRFANPSDPVYTWNDTMDNSIYAFAIGKVAMIIAPSWRAFDIRQISPNLRFKIAPIPQLSDTPVTWASYWAEGVSSKSKYQKQAWEFLKFLTSKESAITLYTEASKNRLFGEPYARVELGSSIASDPYSGAYVKQAANARSFPLASRTFDEGLNDKMIKYLEDAVNAIGKGSSPASEVERLASGFKQVLSTYGLVSSSAQTTQ